MFNFSGGSGGGFNFGGANATSGFTLGGGSGFTFGRGDGGSPFFRSNDRSSTWTGGSSGNSGFRPNDGSGFFRPKEGSSGASNWTSGFSVPKGIDLTSGKINGFPVGPGGFNLTGGGNNSFTKVHENMQSDMIRRAMLSGHNMPRSGGDSNAAAPPLPLTGNLANNLANGGGANAYASRSAITAPTTTTTTTSNNTFAIPSHLKKDYEIIERHKADIEYASSQTGTRPERIAAIISRESNAGQTLRKDGTGDRGNAFGVGQIDKNHHALAGTHDPWSREHLVQVAQFNAENEKEIAKKCTAWTPQQIAHGAAAAYNLGPNGISCNANTIDAGSTGNNYGSDVLSREQVFKQMFDETGK